MNIDLPIEASQFIEGLVASGEYPSADEAVAEGIRLLMSRQQLRSDIQAGIDELDAGNRTDATEVYAEARRRINAMEQNQQGR
jgi:antitoxin ParD1/3/4